MAEVDCLSQVHITSFDFSGHQVDIREVIDDNGDLSNNDKEASKKLLCGINRLNFDSSTTEIRAQEYYLARRYEFLLWPCFRSLDKTLNKVLRGIEPHDYHRVEHFDILDAMRDSLNSVREMLGLGHEGSGMEFNFYDTRRDDLVLQCYPLENPEPTGRFGRDWRRGVYDGKTYVRTDPFSYSEVLTALFSFDPLEEGNSLAEVALVLSMVECTAEEERLSCSAAGLSLDLEGFSDFYRQKMESFLETE